jgi:hypothetical protein
MPRFPQAAAERGLAAMACVYASIAATLSPSSNSLLARAAASCGDAAEAVANQPQANQADVNPHARKFSRQCVVIRNPPGSCRVRETASRTGAARNSTPSLASASRAGSMQSIPSLQSEWIVRSAGSETFDSLASPTACRAIVLRSVVVRFGW